MASMLDNQIYVDMINYLETGKDDLATRTKCLMTSVDTERHFESFKNMLIQNGNNVKAICNLFKYKSVENKAEVEPEPKPENPDLISATTYNDYYKFTMAPVIGAVEDHRPNVHVTFAVDLRDAGIANDMLVNKFNYHAKLSSNLTKLGLRRFNRDILEYLNINHKVSFSPIHTSYWTKPENSNKIFGKSDTPNTLLGTSITDVPELLQIIQCLGKIQKYDDNTGQKTGEERNIIIPDDFHTNTIILNGKFIPYSQEESFAKLSKIDPLNVESLSRCVVLSMYVGPDAKSGSGKKKLHIEATGKWRNVSWLETSMMQTVYETAHTEDLRTRQITYGQWLTEALFRTYLGMKYLEETRGAENIKVALFSGRRTGGFLYNLLQVYLWSTFSTSFGPSNQVGRNLGTSSVDAWYQLTKQLGMTGIVAPAGTHAHELSMVLSSIYAKELDKHANNIVKSINSEGKEVVVHNLVLTQVLGHYLYYRLTHQKSPAPMPMLPDTLGTESFLRAANVILSPLNMSLPTLPETPATDADTPAIKILRQRHAHFGQLEAGKLPFLRIIASARQDSGELKDFKKLMATYNYLGGMMASEIDDISDFNEAQSLGYGLAGVGGALGDSEKAWNTTGGRTFTASMAVKAVRVFFNGVLDYKNLYSFPVKTGDGDAVKVTADTTLDVNMYSECVGRANRTRTVNKEGSILEYNPGAHEALNTAFHSLADAIIQNSKQLLSPSQGGRRMKSNMRQINKTLSKFRKNKRTTKSIRKTRRSYRRY